jgi:DNA-binding NarL/FixJ family response regulator
MNILFADDHPLYREGLAEQIRQWDDMDSVVEVGSLREALEKLEPSTDLILLDLQMPGMGSFEEFEKLRIKADGTPILVVSGYADKGTINSVLERGAAGFVPKSASQKTLKRAIQTVLDGEKYIPSLVLDGADGPSPFAPAGRAPAGLSEDSAFHRLTEREVEVLRLLIAGKSNKQIGLDLGLQEITVKIHLRNAYRKIGASNRADVVRLSYEHGFVTGGAAPPL